ncbi:MAG: hypothetical protein DCC49_10930 [Acidobacteria bacterium]|nr:MAG: hypothetical protein DCC49_10930 [Acidobacteriota bacterium]
MVAVALVELIVAAALVWAGNPMWPVPFAGIFLVLLAGWPPGARRGGKPSYFMRLLLLAPLAALCALAVFVASTWAAYQRTPEQPSHSVGPNAVWARHQWVGEPHTSEDYDALAEELSENRITDVFFHVGPLDGDGSISPEKYPNAADLVKNLRLRHPTVRIQAWIGQITVASGGPLELADKEVRKRIVATSGKFLDLGFNGIHYNVEPLPSGDRDFIDLLSLARALTKARGAVLSIAAEEPDPSGLAGDLARLISSGYHAWHYDYYLELTDYVDQIAVMSYDTGVPVNWVYAAVIRRYTARLITLIGGKVTLFMGIPTYSDQLPAHVSSAENMESALTGIVQGVEGYSDSQLAKFGVAIYAQWTTTPEDWATYRRVWLGDHDGFK